MGMTAAAIATAERLVRDALEGLAMRHTHGPAASRLVSAAVVQLAERLALALDAEVKQMRAEQP